MSASPSSAVEPSRAEARREQILCAAVECFRRHGFHGASIALISKAAGMSAGHIYHYFDNKEAIIEAIVARDLEYLLALTAELRAACDVREAMVARAAEGIHNNLDPVSAGLKIEIVAEAARNPQVAEIVRRADEACRASLIETLRHVRRKDGRADDEAHLAMLAEALAAMFDGLLVRAIRNPGLDREQLGRVFQAAIRDLLNQPA